MKTITCRWCWGIYFPENEYQHEECKRKKYAYQKRVQKSLKRDLTIVFK